MGRGGPKGEEREEREGGGGLKRKGGREGKRESIGGEGVGEEEDRAREGNRKGETRERG